MKFSDVKSGEVYETVHELMSERKLFDNSPHKRKIFKFDSGNGMYLDNTSQKIIEKDKVLFYIKKQVIEKPEKPGDILTQKEIAMDELKDIEVKKI